MRYYLAALFLLVAACRGSTAAPPEPNDDAPPSAPSAATSVLNIQQLIDDAPEGGTVTIPPGVYTQRLEVHKPLTINATGATLDAATLGVPLQEGALKIQADNVHLDGLRIIRSSGAGLDLTKCNHAKITHCVLQANVQEGYHVNGCDDVIFSRCRFCKNNRALKVDPDWEAGGGKAWNSNRVQFIECEADHNGGKGIWFDGADGGCTDCLVENCRVHHNTQAGILYEISSGATRITGNAVWENGWSNDNWWGAGICISSSRGVEVDHNCCAWNLDGIIIASQPRNEAPPAIVDNHVHDNIVVMRPMASHREHTALGWIQTGAGTMFAASGHNHARSNSFYWDPAAPEPPPTAYQWDGKKMSSVSAFAECPGGADSQSIDREQALGTLEKYKLPTAPEGH